MISSTPPTLPKVLVVLNAKPAGEKGYTLFSENSQVSSRNDDMIEDATVPSKGSESYES